MSAPLLAVLAVQTPDPNKVVAGWGAFAIFVLLIIAVALLCLSLVRHLRRAQTNADLGVFDSPSEDNPDQTSPR